MVRVRMSNKRMLAPPRPSPKGRENRRVNRMILRKSPPRRGGLGWLSSEMSRTSIFFLNFSCLATSIFDIPCSIFDIQTLATMPSTHPTMLVYAPLRFRRVTNLRKTNSAPLYSWYFGRWATENLSLKNSVLFQKSILFSFVWLR
jgi:hypothetical protein